MEEAAESAFIAAIGIVADVLTSREPTRREIAKRLRRARDNAPTGTAAYARVMNGLIDRLDPQPPAPGPRA